METTAAADEDEEEVDSGGKKAKIDYVDYESGSLNIVFKEKVKWKNPTVSVVDPDGQSYSARITDTGGTSCEIHVKGFQPIRSARLRSAEWQCGTAAPLVR